MPTLETGHVFERYRVIRWLGSGVSGESYEAEDAMLMRKVTLKLIQPQYTLPDSARRQFFRELQGTSALNHPYLAPILDYGELNGRLYTARRFVSSGSLLGTEGRLWFRSPLNEADAIHYTHQLAQVLHYIHSRGYLHGAVTFPNILVLRGPNLNNELDYAPFLLADVGLANFARRFGQEQKAPLPITAAPEQLGKRITPASDQFALAVLLYFWLAGRPPYLGTPEEIEQLKLTETITPITSLNPRITIEQSGILLRALSVYPEDRYPSILAFADALLKTLPPVLPSIPRTEPAQFNGLSMPTPVPTPEAPEQEPVLATLSIPDAEPVSTAPDLDREPYVTPVLAIETEAEPSLAETLLRSMAGEPAPVTSFITIPETDPVITFEPESVSDAEPTETVTSPADLESESVNEKPSEPGASSEEVEDLPHMLEIVSDMETEDAVTPPEQDQQVLPESVELEPEPVAIETEAEIVPEADTPMEQPAATVDESAPSAMQEVQPGEISSVANNGNGYHATADTHNDLPEADLAGTSSEPSAEPSETREAIPARVAVVIITSPYVEEPYEMKLEGDEFTIGRAGSSSILLDQDNLTSRHHALLKREGNRYLILDRRSANGVFVNGQKIYVESEYELLDGDHISIGNYEMIFRSGASHREQEANTDQLTPPSGYEISQLV